MSAPTDTGKTLTIDPRKSWLPLSVVGMLIAMTAHWTNTATSEWVKTRIEIEELQKEQVELTRSVQQLNTKLEFWRRYLAENGIKLPDSKRTKANANQEPIGTTDYRKLPAGRGTTGTSHGTQRGGENVVVLPRRRGSTTRPE